MLLLFSSFSIPLFYIHFLSVLTYLSVLPVIFTCINSCETICTYKNTCAHSTLSNAKQQNETRLTFSRFFFFFFLKAHDPSWFYKICVYKLFLLILSVRGLLILQKSIQKTIRILILSVTPPLLQIFVQRYKKFNPVSCMYKTARVHTRVLLSD